MTVRNTRSRAALAGLGASLAVILLIGLLASPARAGFTAPVGLSGIAANGPKTAIDTSGNAIAVWSQYDGQKWRIQERQISATGALGPVKTLSAAAEKPLWPQIAGNPRGGAIVVWSQPNPAQSRTRIKAQRISADGRLAAGEVISARRRTARSPRIASDARGAATVVWEQSQSRIWRIKARKISSNGTPERVNTLSNPKRKSGSPAIASDARGRAIAVWSQADDKRARIKALRISSKGRLGPAMTLSPPGGVAVPQVASDADGTAIVVWEFTAGNYSRWRIKARRISSAGALGQTKILHAGRAGLAQIAGNARGDTTVVWEADPNIQARQISATGALRPTQTLSSPGLNGYSPGIAVDGAGNATALWFEIDDSSLPENWYLRARQISAAGTVGPMQTLATEAIRNSAIVANPGGDAFAVWTQFDGSNWRVWGSLGP